MPFNSVVVIFLNILKWLFICSQIRRYYNIAFLLAENSIFPRTLILEAFPKLSSIHWENHEVLFFILNMSQSNPSFFIFHMIVNEKTMAVLTVHGFGD